MVSADARDFPPLAARAIKRGADVHVLSDFVAGVAAEELGLDRDRIHPVGIGVDVPDPGAKLSELLTARIKGRPFVLAVGSIVPRKNFPDLVRAFAELTADHRELLLVIAGGENIGSEDLDEAITTHRMADRVLRTGYVTDADKAALLRDAEVVASSALHEGFGMVPLEAMAAGTPVVAAAGGAIPEVCGDAAVLVEPGDAMALAAGIDRALTDEEFASDLVTSGYEQHPTYSWPTMVREMVQLYERLTG